MSIATFCQDLRIFNYEDDYSTPVSLPVTSQEQSHGKITWSGDGKWLCIAPIDSEGGSLPIFKYSNKQLQPLKYVSLPNITSASFFNWTNRNLAVGNENGEIFVWDIKDKKTSVKIENNEKQPIDLISVNSDDAYLASGSLSSNKICLHGLKTNKSLNTLSIPMSKQSSSLKFCLCKKNYLGASSIESTICVWDISRSDFVFKIIHSHAGACTDISFSPINYNVIASVSLTKTLKMYDIKEKKEILDLNIGEPLNCVDIILNGDKIAMGTTGGSVLIYDLRNFKMLHSFKAHSGPVLSLKMQNLKIPKMYKEIEMNTPDVVDHHSRTLDISVIDVFSPIALNSRPNKSNSQLSGSKIFSNLSTPNLNPPSESPSPYEDSFLKKVLSPVPQLSSTHILPKSQSSPYLCPISETPDTKISLIDLTNVSKAEAGLGMSKNGDGDGFHVNDTSEKNSQYGDVVNEVRLCQKELMNEIRSIRREVTELKDSFETKFKVLQDECKSLRDFLVEDIKQEIQGGNCNMKIEQICQRILMNDLNDSIASCEEKINKEVKLNALRLIHIYEKLKFLK